MQFRSSVALESASLVCFLIIAGVTKLVINWTSSQSSPAVKRRKWFTYVKIRVYVSKWCLQYRVNILVCSENISADFCLITSINVWIIVSDTMNRMWIILIIKCNSLVFIMNHLIEFPRDGRRLLKKLNLISLNYLVSLKVLLGSLKSLEKTI